MAGERDSLDFNTSKVVPELNIVGCGAGDEVTRACDRRNTMANFVIRETTTSDRKPANNNGRSQEQQRVLEMVVSGLSIFFTGPAGSGKSKLLLDIIKTLHEIHRSSTGAVAVTATTGLAASTIGGSTIQRFAGVQRSDAAIEDLIKGLVYNKGARKRWQGVKVLIIDEISMMDAEFFDKLEGMARKVRRGKSRLPFGGIQLVITGDFFQLPPVSRGDSRPKFAFEAQSWNVCVQRVLTLKQVFRQKDADLVRMLNEIRVGRVSEETTSQMKALDRSTNAKFVEATELFATNSEVRNANLARLARLPGRTLVFEAADGGTETNIQKRSNLLVDCGASATLELKVGAQVILTKNIDETLTNGSLGKVIDFMTRQSFEAYAQTEESLDAREHSGRSACSGGAELGKEVVVVAQMTKTVGKLPLVLFEGRPGNAPVKLLCEPEEWQVEVTKQSKSTSRASSNKVVKDPSGKTRTKSADSAASTTKIAARRRQIPLSLAWALSIHKSQGQTLDHVKVDLNRVFEAGQAYVALSRAATKEGLRVRNFTRDKIFVHESVRLFEEQHRS